MLRGFLAGKYPGANSAELDAAAERAIQDVLHPGGPDTAVEPLNPGEGVTAEQEAAAMRALEGGSAVDLLTGTLEAVGTVVEVVAGACAAIASAIVAAPAVIITVAVVVLATGITAVIATREAPPNGSTAGEIAAVPVPTPAPATQPQPEPTPATPATGTRDSNGRRYLYHYTDYAGIQGIGASRSIDLATEARYGPGIYLTDLPPDQVMTQRHYAVALFQYASLENMKKVEYWLKIDVTDLPVRRDPSIYLESPYTNRKGQLVNLTSQQRGVLSSFHIYHIDALDPRFTWGGAGLPYDGFVEREGATKFRTSPY